MADASNELLEIILRECGAADQRPWYPSDYAAATGIDRARLDGGLDQLRLGGAIQLTEWIPGKGQGYTLTPMGREILDRPRLLNHVRTKGVAIRPSAAGAAARDESERSPQDWDRGKALQAALASSARPTVTVLLIAMNVACFLVGLALVQERGGSATEYLGGDGNDPNLHAVRHLMGMLEGQESLLRGEWWRLLTCCFVHIGAIHIAVNMWALWSLGPVLERAMGHVRFAWLYLVSGVGGSVAAVYFSPQVGLAGASGAICGLFGALFVWVWLNRAYLRRSSEMLRSLMMNLILLVIISYMPGVSGSGHFGGGVIGLALAVPLDFSRFGRRSTRWLGLVGAVGVTLCIAGAAWYETGPRTELERAQRTYLPKIARMEKAVEKTYNESFRPLVEQGEQTGKVSDEQKKQSYAEFDRLSADLAAFEHELQNGARYDDPRINTALELSARYYQKRRQFFETSKKLVDNDGNFDRSVVSTLNSISRSIKDLKKDVEDSVLFTQRQVSFHFTSGDRHDSVQVGNGRATYLRGAAAAPPASDG